MSLNIDLLRTLVTWAEEEHEKPKDKRRWNQSYWATGRATKRKHKAPQGNELLLGEQTELTQISVACGTAFCLAGNACHLAGDTFVVPSNWIDSDVVSVDYVLTKDTGALTEISARARDLLGITEEEAGVLFAGGNGVREVRQYAAEIADAYGHTLQEA